MPLILHKSAEEDLASWLLRVVAQELLGLSPNLCHKLLINS